MTVDGDGMQFRISEDEAYEMAEFWVRRSRGACVTGGPIIHLPDLNVTVDDAEPEPLCNVAKHRVERPWVTSAFECFPVGYASVCKRCRTKVVDLRERGGLE